MFAFAAIDTVAVVDHRAVRVHRGGAPGDPVVLPGAAGAVPPLLVQEGEHTPLSVLRLTTLGSMMMLGNAVGDTLN